VSKRLMAMLVAATALALIAGGCGGGDEESLTRAEFIEQADAICTESSKQIEREYRAFAEGGARKGGISKAEGQEVGQEILLPNVQSRVEELRELNPPEADEDQITAMLDALEAGVEEGRENPKSLFSGDYPLEEANKMAQEYGFKACGRA
jgi:hypothetical protein